MRIVESADVAVESQDILCNAPEWANIVRERTIQNLRGCLPWLSLVAIDIYFIISGFISIIVYYVFIIILLLLGVWI
eukprot:SAG31_NODE_29418_length_395_cov_1.611486_1_plen_76_part_10